MLLSTNQELRLHIPSNAFDDVSLLQGILDNSEKDFLRDKLGTPLYNRLCAYYQQEVTPEAFYLAVTNGTYAQHPWQELLLNAQRMVANDTMSRYAYQQLISANGAGMNMAASQDYAVATDKMLDKGVQGYKKEAMVSLNNLLLLLEGWAKLTQPMPIDDTTTDVTPPKDDSTEPPTAPTEDERMAEIEEIVNLWQKSEYYYLHHDLLIPTCAVLQQYIDIYANRDKFIRLIPDLRFIQDEYITDVLGEDTLNVLLHADDAPSQRMLRKVRRLMVAYLEERTTVLSIDKTRRQQAHNESISLRTSIQSMLKAKQETEQAKAEIAPDDNKGYENNQPGSKIFVPPMLY